MDRSTNILVFKRSDKVLRWQAVGNWIGLNSAFLLMSSGCFITRREIMIGFWASQDVNPGGKRCWNYVRKNSVRLERLKCSLCDYIIKTRNYRKLMYCIILLVPAGIQNRGCFQISLLELYSSLFMLWQKCRLMFLWITIFYVGTFTYLLLRDICKCIVKTENTS